ncbi:MAG: mechanosensitive ion channel [Bacteroidales bacterium]|nr:mechanosensitive ion channel [Candidatus Cacconaster merdequi]
MKRKIVFAVVALFVTVLPLFAVFNEENLAKTLSVLRYELNQEYSKLGSKQGRLDARNSNQHRQITSMLKKCNELSLILYSQNPDFTFDVTYALGEVTDEYEEFKMKSVPYNDMLARLDLEIDKYENLIKSLKRLPPSVRDSGAVRQTPSFFSDSLKSVTDSIRAEMAETAGDSVSLRSLLAMPVRDTSATDSLRSGRLAAKGDSAQTNRQREGGTGLFILDEQGRADRDSCIFYAEAILNMYRAAKIRTLVDNEYYENASARLEESYQYAQKRYRDIQKSIFVDGQDNYLTVLRNFSSYTAKSFQDAKLKYSTAFDLDDKSVMSHSEWRGPVVIGFIFLVIFHIVMSVLLSILLMKIFGRRLIRSNESRYGSRLPYITLLCGFVIFALSLMVVQFTLPNNFFKVASRLMLIFAWLIVAIVTSMLVRMKSSHLKFGLKLYLPLSILGLVVIVFRIIFIPNNMVNLILPPLLVLFFFWQLHLCSNASGKVGRSDLAFSWATLAVILITTVMALCGYVLMSVTVLMWWLFQLAAAETVIAVYDLLRMYYRKYIEKELSERRKNRRSDFSNLEKGTYIHITWLYDLLTMVLVPVAAVLSVPGSIWLATGIFDLDDSCWAMFFRPLFDLSDSSGNVILHVTIFKVVLVLSLFFVFRYVNYAAKSFYRHFQFGKMRRQSGQDYVRANQINLTLANNVISILTWGVYIILCIVLLKIPMGAISIVAAGLATGIGLALKDVLNNFIYGIQLMSGRLRVGDYIECEGVRGRVERISYQSTQIETLEGVVMAFTNTTLFNKNFMNLTRNNAYEFIKVVVGVKYGSDVEATRQVLLSAMQPLRTKDKFGREIVDPQRGIYVTFDGFGDSSIDLAVKQYVLVEEEIGYVARAREAIYNALNAAQIEIPFPQRDVTVKISHE